MEDPYHNSFANCGQWKVPSVKMKVLVPKVTRVRMNILVPSILEEPEPERPQRSIFGGKVCSW